MLQQLNEMEYLLQQLWKKPTIALKDRISFNFKIPHTIIYKNCKPVKWYYSTKKGHIKKKKDEALDREQVSEHLTQNGKEAYPVAITYKYSNVFHPSNKQHLELDFISLSRMSKLKTFINYSEILTEEKRKLESVIVQQCVNTKGEKYSVIRCYWSTNSFKVEKVVNINQKQNTKLSIYERYLTIEEGHKYCKVEPLLSSLLQQDVIIACNLIQAQFQVNNVHLQQGIFYFAVDVDDYLNLITATHLKLQKVHDLMFSEVKLVYPSQILEQLTQYSRRSAISLNNFEEHQRRLKNLQFAVTLDIEKSKFCPFCQSMIELEVKSAAYCEFTLKNLMKLKRHSEFLRKDCDLTQKQKEQLSYFKKDCKIPEVIRVLFTDMTESQFLMHQHDLQWQFKTVQTCQECFDKLSSLLDDEDRLENEEHIQQLILNSVKSRLSTTVRENRVKQELEGARKSYTSYLKEFIESGKKISMSNTSIEKASVWNGDDRNFVFVTSLGGQIVKRRRGPPKEEMSSELEHYQQSFLSKQYRSKTPPIQSQKSTFIDLRDQILDGMIREPLIYDPLAQPPMEEPTDEEYPQITERSIENPFLRRIEQLKQEPLNEQKDKRISQIQMIRKSIERASLKEIDPITMNPSFKKQSKAHQKLLSLSKSHIMSKSQMLEETGLLKRRNKDVFIGEQPISQINDLWVTKNISGLQEARDLTVTEMEQHYKERLIVTARERDLEAYIMHDLNSKQVPRHLTKQFVENQKTKRVVLLEGPRRKIGIQRRKLNEISRLSSKMGNVFKSQGIQKFQIPSVIQGQEAGVYYREAEQAQMKKTQGKLNTINSNIRSAVTLIRKKRVSEVLPQQ